MDAGILILVLDLAAALLNGGRAYCPPHSRV